MAVENVHSSKSFKATASLVASQYCFVNLDSNGQIILQTTAAGYAVGVLQDKPGAGDPGFVCGPGDITKVQCGGNFAAGAKVGSDTAGKAVSVATGAFLGVARTAGATNGIAEILFQPQGFVAP